MFIIICEGKCIGPFYSFEEAENYGKTCFAGLYLFQVVKLIDPVQYDKKAG